MNQQLADQLLDAGVFLVDVENAKNDIANMQETLENNNKILADYEKRTKRAPGGLKAMKIIGTILLIMGGVYTLLMGISTIAVVVPEFFNTLTTGNVAEAISALFAGIIVLFVPIAMVVVGLVLNILRGPKLKKYFAKAQVEYEEACRKCAECNAELNEEIARIENELRTHYAEKARCVDFVPPDYRTIDAIGFMLKAVENLRADTLKEAINLYDTELKHRQMMEQAEIQRIQNENMMYAMEQINREQRETNRNLRTTQILQTIDILTK